MIPKSIPPITMAASDHRRLEELALRAFEDGHPVAHYLLTEVRRAHVCDDAELPADVARLNGWVAYRVGPRAPLQSRILVLPEDDRSRSDQLSVLSPVGAAIVGLRTGSRMPYFENVDFQVVTIESLDPPGGIVSLGSRPHDARRAQSETIVRRFGHTDDDGPSAA
jgi:regulator of nucleoside diphosphate kinase